MRPAGTTARRARSMQNVDMANRSAVRAPRRDAENNRRRLLKAAADVFARCGPDVALEEIARAAGVSRATLYRNFPTRHDLAVAVIEDNVALIERRAAELRDSSRGVVRLLDLVLDIQRDSRSVARLLSEPDKIYSSLIERTATALRPLVTHGISEGVLRPGVEVADVLLAVQMSEILLSEEQQARGRKLLSRALFQID
jgi:AcrR family transcriptional regulator